MWRKSNNHGCSFKKVKLTDFVHIERQRQRDRERDQFGFNQSFKWWNTPSSNNIHTAHAYYNKNYSDEMKQNTDWLVNQINKHNTASDVFDFWYGLALIGLTLMVKLKLKLKLNIKKNERRKKVSENWFLIQLPLVNIKIYNEDTCQQLAFRLI